MLFKSLTVLLVAAVSSVAALSVPHHVARVDHHAALAARLSFPRDPGSAVFPVVKKRDTKRCKPRTTSSSSSTPTPTPTPVVNVAPEPEVQEQDPSPAPAPTPDPQPSPEPKPEPKPEPAPEPKPETGGNNNGGGAGGPSFLTGTQSGQATFYAPGLGACGDVHNEGDFIAAASQLLFDVFPGANGNPNQNPICGRRIRLSRNGKSVEVALVDRCESCDTTDIDLSPAAFRQIAKESEGRVRMSWVWI